MAKAYRPVSGKYIRSDGVIHAGYSLDHFLDMGEINTCSRAMLNRKASPLTGIDLNTVIRPGFYGLYGSCTNSPSTTLNAGYGVLEVSAYSDGHIIQVLRDSLWSADEFNVWVRAGSTTGGDSGINIWSSWRRLTMDGDTNKQSLFAENGYAKLSCGLIIQWGLSRGSGYISFPKAFPTQCFQVISSMAHSSDANPHYITLSGVAGYDKGGFTLVSAGYISVGVYQTDVTTDYYRTIAAIANFGGPTRWFAIGY